MKRQHIERIPINQIRVVNPRSRNQVTFRGIVANIGLVGLKKPITVARHQLDKEGTQYDLVCGEGRLQAVTALGGADIPAILTDAPVKERYLMSLVENVARKPPPHSDLLREVKALKKRNYTNAQICSKLGLGRTYIAGILRLLRCGEDRLVEQVESGTLPLTIAVKLATAKSDVVQRALRDAYESGELRGGKFRTVQRLVTSRLAKHRTKRAGESRLTREDLAREYEQHTERQGALVKRASIIHERLAILNAAFKVLLSDPDFVQLLRQEKLDTMPEHLANSSAV